MAGYVEPQFPLLGAVVSLIAGLPCLRVPAAWRCPGMPLTRLIAARCLLRDHRFDLLGSTYCQVQSAFPNGSKFACSPDICACAGARSVCAQCPVLSADRTVAQVDAVAFLKLSMRRWKPVRMAPSVPDKDVHQFHTVVCQQRVRGLIRMVHAAAILTITVLRLRSPPARDSCSRTQVSISEEIPTSLCSLPTLSGAVSGGQQCRWSVRDFRKSIRRISIALASTSVPAAIKLDDRVKDHDQRFEFFDQLQHVLQVHLQSVQRWDGRPELQQALFQPRSRDRCRSSACCG